MEISNLNPLRTGALYRDPASLTPNPTELKTVDVARTVLDLMTQTEAAQRENIKKSGDEIKQLQKKIYDLLDLINSLNAHKQLNGKEIPLTDTLKNLFQKLEEKGIHLIEKDTKTLSQDRMEQIKSQIHSHIRSLESEIQSISATKMQPKIAELNFLLDCLKKILQKIDDLCTSINRRSKL